MEEKLIDSPKYPRLNVIASAILFSIAAPVIRYVEFGSLSTVFFRSSTGLVSLIILSALDRESRARPVNRYDILSSLAYASMSLCCFSAMRMTSAANAIILIQTSPLFLIPLGYIFLGERAGKRDYIAIAIMIAGIVLCVYEGLDIGGQVGDLLALGGALSFAFLSITVKKNPNPDNKRYLMIGSAIIVLVSLPFQEFDQYRTLDIGLASGLGVIQMAIPMILISRGLKKLPAVEVSVIRNLETILAPIWVALLVGEVPGVFTVIGFILVMTAILIQLGKRRSPAVRISSK